MRTVATLAGMSVALMISAVADAAYTGLQVTSLNATVALDPLDPTNLTAVTRYRVWAQFTNPNDALFVWGGGGGLGPASINNLNATGTGPGTGFLNNLHAGDLPPNSAQGIAANSDTYFTIGVTLVNQVPAGQSISLLIIPGTPGGLQGTSIIMNNGGGVATVPTTGAGLPNPISLAGFTGDGDNELRILLMQLVVAQGQHVEGNFGITINLGSLAGATTTLQGQTFTSIPGSGALPLLALAAFGCGRRRR